MPPLLITAVIAILAMFAALSVGWWYGLILRPINKSSAAGKSLPLYALLAFQFTVAAATIALIYTDISSAIGTFFFPFLIWPSAKQLAVMSHYDTAIWVGLSTGLGLTGCLLMITHSFRYALFPALVFAAIVTVHFAEARSKQRMTFRALELGATCLARHSFAESLQFWGEEFQFDLHASAEINGIWHGWSYVEDDFYVIPDRGPKDGNGLQAKCASEKFK